MSRVGQKLKPGAVAHVQSQNQRRGHRVANRGNALPELIVSMTRRVEAREPACGQTGAGRCLPRTISVWCSCGSPPWGAPSAGCELRRADEQEGGLRAWLSTGGRRDSHKGCLSSAHLLRAGLCAVYLVPEGHWCGRRDEKAISPLSPEVSSQGRPGSSLQQPAVQLSIYRKPQKNIFVLEGMGVVLWAGCSSNFNKHTNPLTRVESADSGTRAPAWGPKVCLCHKLRALGC